jgi:hypothetical protein
VHGAGDVDHEDVLARVDLRRRDGQRRLDDGEEEVLATAVRAIALESVRPVAVRSPARR